jgi:hypothetical protein
VRPPKVVVAPQLGLCGCDSLSQKQWSARVFIWRYYT